MDNTDAKGLNKSENVSMISADLSGQEGQAYQQDQQMANRLSGVADNKPMSCESAISVIKRTGLLMSNLALVYYFEYVITTGLPVAIAGQIK